MIKKGSRNQLRVKRHRRNMRFLRGTGAKPRLCLFKSLKHIYAQVIDDEAGRTLFGMGTGSKGFKEKSKKPGSNKENAAILGAMLGQACKEQEIKKVIFDRNGYRYHGVVQAVAEGVRKAGISF